MASDSHIFETLTKLDNLSSAFRTVTNAHHHSNDSSLLLDSESPADDQIIRRIQSADQLVGLSDVNRASSQHRPTSLTLSSSGKGSSTFSSPTSGDADAPESPQYTKFGESPFRESVDLSVSGTSGDPSSLEQMLSSIPRRREFAEQFLDLAQLHQQEDAPRAKWDDASRLFPKQFGLSSSVAINICNSACTSMLLYVHHVNLVQLAKLWIRMDYAGAKDKRTTCAVLNLVEFANT
uniref:EF-hand domain-containing protein n=1 Tax=Mesocestoides corti TaxID=53468 RepID=A0A5K3FSB5_MESCO